MSYCDSAGCWQFSPCPLHGRTIERRLLRGHSSSVTCLELGRAAWCSAMMISGSEDSTVRVWDLASEKAIRCLKGFPESCGNKSTSSVNVNSVCFSPNRDVVACAAGNVICMFDLRSKSIVLKECLKFAMNTDEINEISFNEKGTFLAAADDSGEVKVFDMKQHTQQQPPSTFKTLRGHENICSSVVFHPKQPWELFSGGFDCSVRRWDFSKARSSSLFDSFSSSAAATQCINPPFVHSLAVSSSVTWLAAGLGNQNVWLHNFADSKERQLEGHNGSVSQVQFLDDNTLLSAGNDRLLMLWDLSSLQSTPAVAKTTKRKSKSKKKGNLQTEESTEPELQAKLSLEHPLKLNWVRGRSKENELNIYVGDVSPHISSYRLTG